MKKKSKRRTKRKQSIPDRVWDYVKGKMEHLAISLIIGGMYYALNYFKIVHQGSWIGEHLEEKQNQIDEVEQYLTGK
jgi:hypothetical protein